MMALMNAILAPHNRRMRAMSGPVPRRVRMAAALACVLGLAACGGGGGGVAGGGNGGGGDPTPVPYRLVTDPAQVATIADGIEAFTPPANDVVSPTNRLSGYRLSLGDLFAYSPGVSTNDPPVMGVGPPGGDATELPRQHVRDNVYLFTDTYTHNSVSYKATMLLFLGPDEQTSGYYHYWGVWMRQNTATGDWDRIWPFKRYWNEDAGYSQHGTNALPTIPGTASYTGSASGLYTKGAAAGYFNADATLSVNFNDSSVDAADRYSFTGNINNFKLSGNEEVDWSVALSGRWPRSGGSLSLARASGTATGSGAAGRVFDVFAYGPTSTGGQPSNVITGEFKAFFTDGAAIGAFSATR